MYVMVPVPEELVESVLQYLRWGFDEPPEGTWTPAELAERLDTLDGSSRRLLELVAEASLRGELVTMSSAAEALGSSSREVLGTMLEINYLIPGGGGRPAVLGSRLSESPSKVDSGLGAQLLVMDEDVAHIVQAADRPRA